MHELGIAQDFLKVILQQAGEHHLSAVTKITIVLGEASGIERDFLHHSLKDHALPGTIAAGAQIEYVLVPLSARCASCGKAVTTEKIKALACPYCGSPSLDITAGRETYVQSIEGE